MASGHDQRKIYTGKSLTDLTMPLGGIGAGSIGLAGSGELREWQIFNQVDRSSYVAGSFFAVWAKAGSGQPVARLLQKRPIGEAPGVKEIKFVGEYPIAELTYEDAKLPAKVSLQAFSPFIPFGSRDSGLPAVAFVFTVQNRTRKPMRVSLLASLQNAVGHDGHSAAEGVGNPNYGGNVNELRATKDLTAIHMTNGWLTPEAKRFGTMTLATTAGGVSPLAQWDDLGKMWQDFAADGKLGRSPSPSISPEGKTWNAALAAPLTLRPGQRKQVVFLVTWHFPNHYADYHKDLAQHRIGNQYSNWFGDSLAVARYVAAQFDRLAEGTRRFRDTFYDSTLPYWLLDCVTSQISTLRSQTCMWIEDGTFAGFEGCAAKSGCCPMNCTHVWNYEQTLAKLFPDLERNMRETDLLHQQDPSGFVHHRTVLPLSLPRASGPFVDGHLGTILKCYREYLQSDSKAWLDKLWPRIKLAMDWAMDHYDADGDGVIDGEQWNTYDCAVYGPNSFIGSLYLGALRAAEEMAKVEGDPASVKRYRERYEKGSLNLAREIWNGEYYEQKYDAEKYTATQYGKGCLSDQLLGQWWAHVVNLGYLLPPEHVKRALGAIMQHNFRRDLSDFQHKQRVFAAGHDGGLLCCTWPRGGRPERPIFYCDEVWTGIEYQVAAHMIYEGMTAPGLEIVKTARKRYDGVPRPPFARNPWNEIECGDHYARAMSSWSLLLAAQGYHYNGPKGELGFAPRLSPEHHRSFFSTAQGYGAFTQQRVGRKQRNTIELKAGQARLTTLTLQLPRSAKALRSWAVSVKAAGPRVAATVRLAEGSARITLGRPVRLQAGDRITVALSW